MLSNHNNKPAAGARAPVRLLTLTTLFPNAAQPRHGIFIANRLRRICDSGRATSTVIAAVPFFPGAYRYGASVPLSESMHGFNVYHPRYLHVPGVGMRMQPLSLATAILAELRRQRLDATAFDVVDAHYFYPDGIAAARVASALGLPLVISARGSDINLIGDIPFARARMLQAAERAQGLIAVSEALVARMAALGMPAERIVVLRNGVDTDVFSPFPRAEARKRLALKEHGDLVLGVGNLVPEKGYELLVRAVASLSEARLLLVGQGPLQEALRALGDALAPGRVEFRDNVPQSELRFAYAAANVLGHPSLREGWPNVLLEAMSCGIPVVASEVGGTPEILQQGAPGQMLAERNLDTWSQALRTILDASWAEAAVRRYATQFGWEEVVVKQSALYEEIADGWADKSHRPHQKMALLHA